MRLSLSTNWCNRRLDSGEAIVDAALALGFEELELGFHTSEEQVEGFRRRLDEMPVGSIHAFCPVPISAPCGYPELYQLASFDEDARAIARVQIVRNLRFAASIGADTVVLHAGRVEFRSFLSFLNDRRRRRRGERMIEVFRREIELLAPELEANRVTLALENMPYPEGFPNADEVAAVTSVNEWVKPWYDIGHGFVRGEMPPAGAVGVHVSDSEGGHDHLAPGKGKIDFAALRETIGSVRHVVFEPASTVTEDELREGIAFFRKSQLADGV